MPTEQVVTRILGIDPGTQVVGFGCLEVVRSAASVAPSAVPLARRVGNLARGPASARAPKVIDVGVLRLGSRTARLEDRLCALAQRLDELITRLGPTELALEEAFAGKSIQSAMRIGEARGVVLAGARRRELEISQYPPARIKRVVTGNGAATKEVVARMVVGQLGLREVPQPADATDALAVALCRLEEAASPLGAMRARAKS